VLETCHISSFIRETEEERALAEDPNRRHRIAKKKISEERSWQVA